MVSASTAGDDLAVETRDLRVDYGDTVAVRGIDLKVPRGEVYGLVGPNGAGKTSTFLVLATLMEPTYGDVRVCGRDSAVERSAVRQRLAYMPDLAPVPSDLQCWEFLEMFAGSYGLHGDTRRRRIDECLEAVSLSDKRRAMCRTLSRGMKQRLVLAKTLLHRPEVMILDEPASGLDPVHRARLRETMRKVAEDGRTVIISSHILAELADMCTSLGLMSHGELVDSGPVAEVVDRQSSNERELTVHLLEKAHAAETFLRRLLDAPDLPVRTSSAWISFPFSGDAHAQSELLSALVEGGFRPASLEVGRSTIEEVFLDLSTQKNSSKEQS